MTRYRRRGRDAFASFVVLASVVAAGCGSDDDSSEATEPNSAAGSGVTAEPDTSGAPSLSEPVTFRIMAAEGTYTTLPQWVADAQGFFEEENLDVEISQSSANTGALVAAMVAGESDSVMVGVGTITQLRQDGQADAVFLPGLTFVDRVAIAPPGSDIPTPTSRDDLGPTLEWLEGKTVGVRGINLSPHKELIALMRDAGADPDSVSFVDVAPSASLALLSTGDVDMIWGNPNPAYSLIAQGQAELVFRSLVNTPEVYARSILVGAIATEEFLADHPGFGDAYARAMEKSVAWLQDPANVEAIATLLEENQSSFDGVEDVIPDMEFVYATDAEALQSGLDFFTAAGVIAAEPPITATEMLDEHAVAP